MMLLQVEELASLLRKRDAVESLVLRNSSITNDGIEQIASSLKHTPATDLKVRDDTRWPLGDFDKSFG